MNSVAYSKIDVLGGPKEVKQKTLRDATPTSEVTDSCWRETFLFKVKILNPFKFLPLTTNLTLV